MSYEKLYQISFFVATLFALTMLSSNLETNQRVYSAKNEVKTSSGVLETKDDRKENLPKIIWNKTKTNAEVISKTANPVKSSSIRTPTEIYEQVKHLGYREEPTKALISTCKGASLRPDHCILVWLTLMYNEAGNQQNSKACVDRNNCFGIQSWKKSYSSLDEGMENWVQTYNKYWINAEWPEFFYSKNGSLPKSRYCTSETSSWSSIGCPRWLKIASDKWSKLYKIIY